MADKTTGELKSIKIEDLPNSPDIYDDFKMPGEFQGGAVHVTGAQIKNYAQEATKLYATAAELSAYSASEYASSSQSALQGVKDAIDNLPDGATVVINDLTTGGTSAALSAEMGKQLEQSKVPVVTVDYTKVTMSADDLSVPLALIKIGGTSNAELWEAFGNVEAYAYVRSIFYYRAVADRSHVQIAYSYTNAPTKMAIRTYNGNTSVWTPWRLIAGTDVALLKAEKPTGSYKGTSSTAQQNIDTKGIGNCAYIHGGTLGALVGKSGGLGWDTNGGTIKTIAYSAAHFINGVLTIATDSFYVNSSSVTYTYQVL